MKEDIRLEDYDVSPKTGFLPPEFPLEELPQEYYRPWENIAKRLPAFILTRRIRWIVDERLDTLSTSYLNSKEELRRGYQILGFLTHAYVWTGTPVSKIPQQLARPLIEISNRLEVRPLATYSSLCLWNFRPLVKEINNDNWHINNLATICTFTGSTDESGFYLVSVYLEYKGGEVIQVGLKALERAREGSAAGLVGELQRLAQLIDNLGAILMRMEEFCDPHVFYFRIRPFLNGWTNMKDIGFDRNGLIYGDSADLRSYSGGSNAQSSLFQFLDMLLGIEHYAEDGELAPSKNTPNAFLLDMLNYMPKKHREFLLKIKQNTCIKQFVLEKKETDGPLTLSYDACLAMMKLLREKHLQIVTRYIVLQQKKEKLLGSYSTARSSLSKTHAPWERETKGTGGTSLLRFLKQCRDESGEPAAGSWGKRILTDANMRLKYSKSNGINED